MSTRTILEAAGGVLGLILGGVLLLVRLAAQRVRGERSAGDERAKPLTTRITSLRDTARYNREGLRPVSLPLRFGPATERSPLLDDL